MCFSCGVGKLIEGNYEGLPVVGDMRLMLISMDID